MVSRISMAALVLAALAGASPLAAKEPCRNFLCDFFSNDGPPTDDGSPCLTLCRLTGLGDRAAAKDRQGAAAPVPSTDD